ncbi:MAG: hypothetical protein ACLRMJ_04210 [Alistipes finegoldii]
MIPIVTGGDEVVEEVEVPEIIPILRCAARYRSFPAPSPPLRWDATRASASYVP